jgi:ATP-dependent Zn protease
VTPAKWEARHRPSRIERTAYHEAGHAVAAYLRRLRFTNISIIPDRGTLGRCEFSEAPVIIDLNAHSIGHARRRIETLIIVSLAGVVAECLLTERHNWRGAHADLHDAARYALFVTGNDRVLPTPRSSRPHGSDRRDKGVPAPDRRRDLV